MSVTKVHHLNAATMCPRAPAFLLGQDGKAGKARMICHCLLLETARDGLILVDTGFGTADLADLQRVPRSFRFLTAPQMRREETLLAQLEARGLRADDVRHIVLTHLDLDHAGGLSDFPGATVHLHQRELEAAQGQADRAARMRYRPAQWAHGPKWRTYAESGDTWRDVPAVRTLDGISAEVALLPMHGHSFGHSAVVVGAPAGRTLVHAGDAYFHRSAVSDRPAVPFGLRVFEKQMRVDPQAWQRSQEALRRLQLAHADVTVFCAHDVVELEQIARR
jgi:glyoxylase-like metal-dependent hydrolase (beta-lactamase superfamily II)